MKILVDMDKCQHYGQCVFEADDIFSLGEDGKLSYRSEVDENRRSDVESAVDVCPMQAISIE